jgi:SAM-dependent methyltransferase
MSSYASTELGPESPELRVSGIYGAERGRAYSRWQLNLTRNTGAISARKFQRHISPTDRILDFGCGGGEILEQLDCRSRLGVEPNPHSREAARGRNIDTVPALSQVELESIDVAISNHALEHCKRPLDELVEIKLALRPGGKLVLVVPIDDWRTQRRYDPMDENHHLYTWNPLLLGNLLSEAGFRVESVAILRRAWPRGVTLLDRVLPLWLFESVCWLWSNIKNVRELKAICVKV